MGSMEGKAEETGIVTAVMLQKPAQADAEAGFGVDEGLLLMRFSRAAASGADYQ